MDAGLEQLKSLSATTVSDALDLSDTDRDKIYRANAVKLLKLKDH